MSQPDDVTMDDELIRQALTHPALSTLVTRRMVNALWLTIRKSEQHIWGTQRGEPPRVLRGSTARLRDPGRV